MELLIGLLSVVVAVILVFGIITSYHCNEEYEKNKRKSLAKDEMWRWKNF